MSGGQTNRFQEGARIKNWKVEGLNGACVVGDEWNPMHRNNGVTGKMAADCTRLCAAIDIRNTRTGDFFAYEIWFIR